MHEKEDSFVPERFKGTKGLAKLLSLLLETKIYQEKSRIIDSSLAAISNP